MCGKGPVLPVVQAGDAGDTTRRPPARNTRTTEAQGKHRRSADTGREGGERGAQGRGGRRCWAMSSGLAGDLMWELRQYMGDRVAVGCGKG